MSTAVTYHGNNRSRTAHGKARRRRLTPFQRFMHRNIGRILFFGLIAFGILIGSLLTHTVMSWKYSHDMRDYGRELSYTTYTVKSGDTMWDIAADMAALNPEFPDLRQYLYMLQEANHNYGDTLIAGTQIIIPYYRSGTGRDFISIYERYGLVEELESNRDADDNNSNKGGSR